MWSRRRARAAEAMPSPDPAVGSRGDVHADYVLAAPSPQTQLDLFPGQWTSAVPTTEPTTSGPRADLFDDDRVRWAIETLGPVAGWRVVELGPLEGGHTTMLERAGADVTAIEANTRAFLRCLVVKNLLGLRARFELGDFVAFLRDHEDEVDLLVALGVLYHLEDPVELLLLAGRRARRLALWTHYYDEAVNARRPDVAARFAGRVPIRHGDVAVTGHRYEYREGATDPSFCGGARPTATWLERADLLRVLDAAGFGPPTVQFDDPDTPHGPSISLVAERA